MIHFWEKDNKVGTYTLPPLPRITPLARLSAYLFYLILLFQWLSYIVLIAGVMWEWQAGK